MIKCECWTNVKCKRGCPQALFIILWNVTFCVSLSCQSFYWRFPFYLNKIHPVSWVVLLRLISRQETNDSWAQVVSPSRAQSLVEVQTWRRCWRLFRIVSYKCWKSAAVVWRRFLLVNPGPLFVSAHMTQQLDLIRNTPQLLLGPFHASDGGKWTLLSRNQAQDWKHQRDV